VNEIIWNVFAQTGNVEMYLLLRELEERDTIDHVKESPSIDISKNT